MLSVSFWARSLLGSLRPTKRLSLFTIQFLLGHSNRSMADTGSVSVGWVRADWMYLSLCRWRKWEAWQRQWRPECQNWGLRSVQHGDKLELTAATVSSTSLIACLHYLMSYSMHVQYSEFYTKKTNCKLCSNIVLYILVQNGAIANINTL